MERNATVEALFQDLMNNGSMDDSRAVHPSQIAYRSK